MIIYICKVALSILQTLLGGCFTRKIVNISRIIHFLALVFWHIVCRLGRSFAIRLACVVERIAQNKLYQQVYKRGLENLLCQLAFLCMFSRFFVLCAGLNVRFRLLFLKHLWLTLTLYFLIYAVYHVHKEQV